MGRKGEAPFATCDTDTTLRSWYDSYPGFTAKRAFKPRAPRENLSGLRPIAIRFIPPKDLARLRRLGLRFKTGL